MSGPFIMIDLSKLDLDRKTTDYLSVNIEKTVNNTLMDFKLPDDYKLVWREKWDRERIMEEFHKAESGRLARLAEAQLEEFRRS